MGAGVRGVDEAAVADVHADMPDAVEEDEVARPERAALDPPAEAEVGVGAVREPEPEMGVHVPDEAGAVEAAAGRVAAVAVRDAEQPPREADGTDADGLGPLEPGHVRPVQAWPVRLEAGRGW